MERKQFKVLNHPPPAQKTAIRKPSYKTEKLLFVLQFVVCVCALVGSILFVLFTAVNKIFYELVCSYFGLLFRSEMLD